MKLTRKYFEHLKEKIRLNHADGYIPNLDEQGHQKFLEQQRLKYTAKLKQLASVAKKSRTT